MREESAVFGGIMRRILKATIRKVIKTENKGKEGKMEYKINIKKGKDKKL